MSGGEPSPQACFCHLGFHQCWWAWGPDLGAPFLSGRLRRGATEERVSLLTTCQLDCKGQLDGPSSCQGEKGPAENEEGAGGKLPATRPLSNGDYKELLASTSVTSSVNGVGDNQKQGPACPGQAHGGLTTWAAVSGPPRQPTLA